MVMGNNSKKDPSLMKLPDNVLVPTSLKNAVNKIREIGFIPNQCLVIDIYSQHTTGCENVLCDVGFEDGFLSVGWHNIEEENQIDKMKGWKNFDCIWYYYEGGRWLSKFNIETDDFDFAMKLLTDLFVYLNPTVNIEDVTVSLDFYNVANALGGGYRRSDYEYVFYPDGKESSTEQYYKCINLLDRYILEIEQ